MLFFISYHLIRSFFGGTYWIVSKSYQGIRYLVVHRKEIQKKTTNFLLTNKELAK